MSAQVPGKVPLSVVVCEHYASREATHVAVASRSAVDVESRACSLPIASPYSSHLMTAQGHQRHLEWRPAVSGLPPKSRPIRAPSSLRSWAMNIGSAMSEFGPVILPITDLGARLAVDRNGQKQSASAIGF